MDVRTTILSAGVTLLKERGITALTQPRVAKAAGVKQSHLTYYFPKRTDLLLGIAEYTIEGIMTDLSTHVEQGPAQAAVADALVAAMLNGVPPRIMTSLVVAADSDPALRPALRKLIKHVRARIQLVLAGIGIRATGNSALLFHAAVLGLAVMHEARRTPESAKELQAGVAQMLELLGATPAVRLKRSAK